MMATKKAASPADTVQLGSVISINLDSVGKDFPFDSINYIDISSVGSGTLNGITGIKFSEAPSRARRLVNSADTILSTVRPNRRSFLFVKCPTPNTVVSTGFAVLRATDKIDSRFLYYTVTHQPFTDYLTNNAKGAAYPAVDTDTIARAEIWLPPLPTQRKIASILSAYDDLIENNLRRIRILEEMAQSLYREWFVKFRFPGHENARFVDSPLGKIPEGWEVATLGGICELRKDKFRKEKHGELPLLNLAKMQQRTLLVGEMGKPDELSTSRIIFEEDDVLFGSIRPYLHKVALAPCQGVTNVSVLVIRPRDEGLWSFLAVLLSSIDVIRWADQHSTGTKMPVIKWDAFQTMPVLMPSESVLHAFETAVEPLLQTVKMTFSRNHNLRQTRDLLLPKLISGELSVSELDINLREDNT